MNMKKWSLIVLLLAAAAVPQPVTTGTTGNANQNQNQCQPLVGNIPNQDNAPVVGSPQVKMHDNGDRVSHYPPYYAPEHGHGGGGRR